MSRELNTKEQFFLDCCKNNLTAFISSTDKFYFGEADSYAAINDSISLARKLTESIFDNAGNLKEDI